jgi:Na+-transporting methylmalonyl-CoA/oxaloacetate decarboxylase gamma subunit
MTAPRPVSLNRGFVFGSAFAALILLALFYSVVSSAVERAEHRRTEVAAPVKQVAAAPLHRQESMPDSRLVVARAPR